MKNRLFAGLVTLALALGGGAPTQAQTVAFDHGGAATATGAGATGTPSLSFNVTAGQNRIVFITATFERDHCTTDTPEVSSTCVDETVINSNFASPTFESTGGANVQIQFTVTGPGGSTTVTNPLVPPAGDLRFANVFATSTPSGCTSHKQSYGLDVMPRLTEQRRTQALDSRCESRHCGICSHTSCITRATNRAAQIDLNQIVRSVGHRAPSPAEPRSRPGVTYSSPPRKVNPAGAKLDCAATESHFHRRVQSLVDRVGHPLPAE